jgi:hypothetical protein
MESLEQNLIAMLQGLPIPITVTWQSGLYHWQYDEEQGEAPDIVGAVEQALRAMMQSLAPGSSSEE